MQTIYFVLLLLSVLCFGAAAYGLWPQRNLVAAGLFFAGLVALFKAGSHL